MSPGEESESKKESRLKREKVRKKHQDRPLKERSADEESSEPYGTFEQWLEDPDAWDYPYIDDALPSEFTMKNLHKILYGNGKGVSLKHAIEKNKFVQSTVVIETLSGNRGVEAGRMQLTWNPKTRQCELALVWIEQEFRGTGLSNYLMREVTKFADFMGINISLLAAPFVPPPNKATDEEVNLLMDYYDDFGFVPLPSSPGLGNNRKMLRHPRNPSNNSKKK